MTIKQITIRTPDDMHLHLRDGKMLETVTPYSSQHYGRAIIMPNLTPPITNLSMATVYQKSILNAVPKTHSFEPLMTLYLTENTSLEDIEIAAKSDIVKAFKLYPAGATTNSDLGVKDIKNVMPLLEKMAELNLSLLVHGEVTDDDIDIFDREAVFIETILEPLRQKIPKLRIVMEHVTTKNGVDYILSSDKNLFATLTVHHLMLNRNAMLAGGIKPHYYCLPILKREQHRLALRSAATSGDKRFFLGTDSAPHTISAKESACGCAGVFTSINSLSYLATVFEEENALDNLEAFTSLNGCAFYDLPPNENMINLTRMEEPIQFPTQIESGEEKIQVFNPHISTYWRVENVNNQT